MTSQAAPPPSTLLRSAAMAEDDRERPVRQYSEADAKPRPNLLLISWPFSQFAADCHFPAHYLHCALAEQLIFGCHSSEACERMLLTDRQRWATA